jgi:hypothetical protein
VRSGVEYFDLVFDHDDPLFSRYQFFGSLLPGCHLHPVVNRLDPLDPVYRALAQRFLLKGCGPAVEGDHRIPDVDLKVRFRKRRVKTDRLLHV